MTARKAQLHCACMHRFQPPSPGWYAHLSDQVDYLGHEGTPLFTQDGAVDAVEARRLLKDAVGRQVAFHRLILSPSLSSGLRSLEEVQPWTQAVVADLRTRLQRDLVYVAAAHRGLRAQPHSHVLIGGRARVSATPRAADVLLRLEECVYLRERGTEQARALAAQTARRRAELVRYTHTYRQGERS